MRRRSMLPFVLLIGGLAGCGAGASRADAGAAELQGWTAETQSMREHAQLLDLQARLVEVERQLASQKRACQAKPESPSADVARAQAQPKTKPLRSQGDFQAEARVAEPAAAPPVPGVGAGPPPATAASERERLEQLLEGLREYVFDPRSGLSVERREALRILLRRDRQLDLMNPWVDR